MMVSWSTTDRVDAVELLDEDECREGVRERPRAQREGIVDEVVEHLAVDPVAPPDHESHPSMLRRVAREVGIEHASIERPSSLIAEDRIGRTAREVVADALGFAADDERTVFGLLGTKRCDGDRLVHTLRVGIDRRLEVPESVGGDNNLNIHTWRK